MYPALVNSLYITICSIYTESVWVFVFARMCMYIFVTVYAHTHAQTH